MRNLFILRGAPASGKSTWIKENNLQPYTLSADGIRLMYQSPVTTIEGERVISQNNDTAVWTLLLQLLEQRMNRGEFIVIDATHYKSSLITKYKDLVDKYRYRVNVVDFSNVTEEELLKRNAARDSYKKVPEEVISKMVVALKDVNEVKKAYNIISPEEATEILNSPLKPVVLDSSIDRVVVFGDIHGCYDPLKEYFDKNPFNEHTCYIFVGDYLDRGPQNKEVLEFLLSIYKNKNVILLEGNHERWLRIYADSHYNINDYKKENVYHDTCTRKILAQLDHRKILLEKKNKKNKELIDTLRALLQKERETNPDAKCVFFQFEAVDVRQKCIELQQEITNNEKILDILIQYIHGLRWESGNTRNALEIIDKWYHNTFNEKLSYDVVNLLKDIYPITPAYKDNPIRSVEFLKHTVPQIEDLDKSELRQLCRKFSQLSYFTFGGCNYLVTHGGVPCMPDIFTPAEEIIKGVGKYEDHDKIDKMFNENEEKNKTHTIQIHGHRNILRVPTVSNDNKTFNLEGQVEFGGHLRILELNKVISIDCEDEIENTIVEIKNNNFLEQPKEKKEEKTDLEILKEMCQSKWVQMKELDDNIVSFNFTREAFEKDHWNELTCHARGLFVDKTTGEVVARSFGKFFNYKQHATTESGYMKENIKWPLIGYKKENGFLGIISKHNNKVRFFTKSTDQGDYVNWFIGVLCDHYNLKYLGTRYTDIYNQLLFLNTQKNCDISTKTSYLKAQSQMVQELKNKLNPLLDEGYSYVFECIDKDNDPHIIKYDKNKIVLLEVFKNQLKEEHLNWFELGNVEKKLGIPLKFKELEFNNWEDFENWKITFRQGLSQWDCKHEGYVFEDQNGYRVKFKSTFYNWWKQMRGVKDVLAGGRTNKKIYKTKEEIQCVKLLETFTREELKNMSIIDVQDKYYKMYPLELDI